MALMVDGQLTTLATKMVDDVMYVPPATPGGRYPVTAAGRAASIVKMKGYLSFFMTYISGDKTKTPGSDDYKGFLEVGGGSGADNLAVSLDSGVRQIEAYVSGTGSNNPVPGPTNMAATPYPVTGVVFDSKLATGAQTNGGRGLVK